MNQSKLKLTTIIALTAFTVAVIPACLQRKSANAASKYTYKKGFTYEKISPLVGVSKPANILKMVVFPHPEGPKNVTNSPSFIVRLKS